MQSVFSADFADRRGWTLSKSNTVQLHYREWHWNASWNRVFSPRIRVNPRDQRISSAWVRIRRLNAALSRRP